MKEKEPDTDKKKCSIVQSLYCLSKLCWAMIQNKGLTKRFIHPLKIIHFQMRHRRHFLAWNLTEFHMEALQAIQHVVFHMIFTLNSVQKTKWRQKMTHNIRSSSKH